MAHLGQVGETIVVRYSIWLPILLVFFVVAGTVGSIAFFANGVTGMGILISSGTVILAALIPLSRTTVLTFGPEDLKVHYYPWSYRIRWEEITRAELKVVGKQGGGTRYMCLSVTAAAKERIGRSYWAFLLNMVTSDKHDYWVVADLLTMSASQILDHVRKSIATADMKTPSEAV